MRLPCPSGRNCASGTATRARSFRFGLPRLFASFIDSQFFVKTGDHLSDAGFGESLGGDRLRLLQSAQPCLDASQLLLRFLVFRGISDHSSISAGPCGGFARSAEKLASGPRNDTLIDKADSVSRILPTLFQDEAAVLAVFDPNNGYTLATLHAIIKRAGPLSAGIPVDARFAPILAIADAYTGLPPWTGSPCYAEGVLVLRMRQVPEGNACPEVRQRAVAGGLAVLDLSNERVFAPPALQAEFERSEWAGPAPQRGRDWPYAGCFLSHPTFGKGRVLDVGTYKKRRVFVVQFESGSRTLDIEYGLPHVKPLDAASP
jgi:hypothetical protein